MLEATKWLRDVNIEIPLENGEVKRIQLDKLQRYMLLKLIWKSQFFNYQEKLKLLQRERNIEFGDVDDIENFGVQASLPDDDQKKKTFNDYIK